MKETINDSDVRNTDKKRISEQPENSSKPLINFPDFEKLDLRVAEIRKVEEIEGADKLYKLTIDVGDEERILVAGIKKNYSADELGGKKIIIVANLAPKMLKGIESKGMLLAASNGENVILLTTDSDIEAGSKVS